MNSVDRSIYRWIFGDDINTDEIIPGRYNVTTDPVELSKYAFYEVCPEFSKQARQGDIIIAGNNFGCGSSREHAVIAIKAAGIRAIIAKSYARIFYRNAINLGLRVITIPDLPDIQEDDDFILNEQSNFVSINGEVIHYNKESALISKLIDSGGIITYLRDHDLSELGEFNDLNHLNHLNEMRD